MEQNQNVNTEVMQQNAQPEKKVQLIHNPLPGPKPHVKRQLGYDYEVPADQMHFDIECPDNDDYDFE